MRWLLIFLCVLPASAGPADAVQKLFDCMERHDAAGARALFVPGAALTVVAPDGRTTVVDLERWLTSMGNSKDRWQERMFRPTVLERGGMAVVWALYDFHLNDKLTHCGVDQANLVKAGDGWRITGLSFTRETTGCEIH